jgi:hypothetical protein
MKKSLITAAVILGIPQLALAQETFSVILDNTTNACRVVSTNNIPSTQGPRYKRLGEYATLDQANQALDSMMGSQCPKS